LHIIVKNTAISIEVFCPLFWERCPQGLFRHPKKIAISDRIDAKISRIRNKLRLRRSWALFAPDELVHGEH